MNQPTSIAVFCGSRDGKNPEFHRHASLLGTWLAKKGIAIVYGGGKKGLMGALSQSAMAAGGHVIGIMPQSLAESEHRNDDITELLIVDSLHTRKKMLYEKCECAIILAGGYGTMDEVFEMLTWNQLSLHDKTIFILNSAGFYDPMISQIHRMHEEELLYINPREKIFILNSPEELESYFD